MPQAGIYVIELRLARSQTMDVGSLGALQFAAGPYLYVGSALRGLPSRIARHVRAHKPLRWHIDYLTSKGNLTSVWVWPPDKTLECRIAAALAKHMQVIPRFGSSDCRCQGHLFRGSGRLARQTVREWTDIIWQWPDTRGDRRGPPSVTVTPWGDTH